MKNDFQVKAFSRLIVRNLKMRTRMGTEHSIKIAGSEQLRQNSPFECDQNSHDKIDDANDKREKMALVFSVIIKYCLPFLRLFKWPS